MHQDLNVKPFLKWVGGKRKLIPQLEVKFPDYIKNNEFIYVEPFLGGGAMFFYLISKYSIKKAYLNDLNDKLIDCYQNIRDHGDNLVRQLKKLEKDYYSSKDKKLFYLERREEYNNSKLSVNKSALLIFLNKTGFNGMYRENSKGEYNIPFGDMNNPLICNSELILNISNILNNNDVEFSSKSFENILINKKNIFYYLDPPYRPISKTSDFTSYTKNKFDDELQFKLKKYCDKINEKDNFLMQSNSFSEDNFFQKLYSEMNIKKIYASRSISADGSKRGKAKEIVITNYGS